MDKRGIIFTAGRKQGNLDTVSRLALTVALGLAALPAFSTASWAACDPVGGNQYVCSGTNTTRQTIDSPVGTLVTTVPGFSVDTTGTNDGNALQILGDGPKGYVDLNGSVLNASVLSSGLVVNSSGPNAGQVVILTNGTISGHAGISASTSGAGASLSVTASGAVTGRGGPAIGVRNGVGSGDINVVTEGPVSGRTFGIAAFNFGTGETRVITTGSVQGTLNYGIYVDNAATATDLSVEAASVIGGITGIQTYNYGSGATSITATETVTGTTEDGVFAYNAPTALGGLSVNVVDVTGVRSGIAVANSGGGSTSIIAGHVSGGIGVIATNGVVDFEEFLSNPGGAVSSGGANAGATDLTFAVASINATQSGIVARNNGTGATKITATGLVEAVADTGIRVENRGTSLTIEAAGIKAGNNGIEAYNYGTGATHITTTGLVEGAIGGIYAENRGLSTDLVIETASVTGGFRGIFAVNSGRGETRIVATGLVDGGVGNGIFVRNTTTATNASIEAASVIGRDLGIGIYNAGTGFTAITASGLVTGTTGYGVIAVNGVNALGGLSVNVVDVSGGRGGIAVANSGGGSTSITAGHVRGGVGIIATNGVVDFEEFLTNPFAAALTADANAQAGDLIIEVQSVTATQGGIIAANYGVGETRITATGLVEATNDLGIYAQNETTATNLIIEVQSVIGGSLGIGAVNRGSGETRIVATGLVDGGVGNGIFVQNSTTATNASIEAASVIGRDLGIGIYNAGTGFTAITASGLVTGTTGYGVIAVNGVNALGGLSVNVVDVSGGRGGIAVANSGGGSTSITAGHVSGGFGIIATNGVVDFEDFLTDPFAAALTAGANAQASDLIIEVQSVTAARIGITATNFGVGETRVATTGLVEGGVAAIAVFSSGGPITIDSSGLIRNLSQRSTDAAIIAGGGPIAFTNGGGMIGTVQFGAGAHTMMNNAAWNTAGGTNEFGGGQLTNAAGIFIIAAGNGGVAETTLLNGLANFNNRGNLVMIDGGAGDVTRQTGGNAQFEAGSVLGVDIDGMGRSDRFITSGTATLSGATLAVFSAGLMPAFGTRYTVLTAEGGLAGQFAGVTGLPANTAFLTIEDTYDANNAYLDVIKYRTFASAGLTPNQIATAGGLDGMGPGAVVNAVAALGTDAQAQYAFDQLSGEVHASARTMMIEDSRFLRSAVNDRLRAAFEDVESVDMPVMAFADGGPRSAPAAADRFVAWGQAFGSWGHWNSDGNAARFDRSIGGFLVGADTLVFDTWRLGAVAGYSRTSFKAGDRVSSGSSDNYHVGLYGGTAWGNLAFRTGAAYSWHGITTSRSVIFPGFSESLEGKYGAATAQVFGELAYGLSAGNTRFEPFANLAYVNLHTDGFTEQGGAAALTSPSANTDATFTTIGLRTSTSFNLGGVAVTAKSMLG